MEKERLYEQRKHGTPDFPIAYYYVDQMHPRYFMPPHFHREIELIRVASGSLRLQLRAENHILLKNDMFFINSGSFHQAIPDNCVYECIVFNPSILRQAPGEMNNNQLISFLNGELELKNRVELPALKELLEELFAVLSAKSDFYGLITYSMLFKAFYIIMTSNGILRTPIKRSTEKNRIIADILSRLENNYTQAVTLDSLSATSGYNKKYFCRIFKEYTGKSPLEYINELRLNSACKDMRYNGLSVTAAAFKNGFNDLSYFCRAFKKYTGLTPRQYKMNSSAHD